MKTKFLLWLLLSLVLCATASAVTIDRVDITGNKRIPEDRIRPYLIPAGSEFDPERISTSIAQLYETSFFLEISVDASVIDNRFVVTYIFQETPLIADVRVEGQKKVTETKIKDTISIKPGEPLNFTRVGSSIKAIQDLYDSEKLYNAQIEYNVEYLSETAVNVVFKIDEGKKARVYNIWFYGNENVSNEELRSVMRTKEKNFWSVMNSSGMLLRDMVEIDRELVRQHYMSLGYATVEVGESEVSNQAEDPSRMN